MQYLIYGIGEIILGFFEVICSMEKPITGIGVLLLNQIQYNHSTKKKFQYNQTEKLGCMCSYP